MDRRSHERLGVQLPCVIHLAGLNPQTRGGRTENISRGGILLRMTMPAMSDIPTIGDIIEAEIPFRPTERFGQRYLRCVGEVVRVSREGDTVVMLALRFRKMRVLPQAIRKAAAVAAAAV